MLLPKVLLLVVLTIELAPVQGDLDKFKEKWDNHFNKDKSTDSGKTTEYKTESNDKKLTLDININVHKKEEAQPQKDYGGNSGHGGKSGCGKQGGGGRGGGHHGNQGYHGRPGHNRGSGYGGRPGYGK